MLFPILAILICILFLSNNGESISLVGLHERFPLLWIIDSAPLVLAGISYKVGSQVHSSNQKLLGRITDINSSLTEKNAELKELVGEKEVLLKEIHHRVKNNLQIITSLLSLQSSFIDDRATRGLFRYSQYRINSMAMIHEMLYQSADISKINYKSYAERLLHSLVVSMKGANHNVNIKLDVPEMTLNVDTAIPLGLLINEVVTNALKYGIKDKDPGTLHLQISKHGHDNYLMRIGDDGPGFTKDINFRDSHSLGLTLIHKLSIQLGGSIEKNNDFDGTEYLLTFKEIVQKT